jgi:signal transduction histidine kinase
VHPPTILIVSDELAFADTVTARCLARLSVPAFTIRKSAECGHETFDLAVVGGLSVPAASVLEKLGASGRPVIYVSRLNAGRTLLGIVTLPEIPGWTNSLAAIVHEVLQRLHAEAESAKLVEKNSQLEREAMLGRYMIEAHHNWSNALTAILGNSDLILLDEEQLPSNLKAQIETIHNMSLRLNEIMQRFSSLQKEMQLMEQQKNSAASVKPLPPAAATASAD